MTVATPTSRAWLVPAALALIVLGAHFLRASEWVGVAACAVAVVLVFVPARWARRIAQLALLLGAAEWAWTALLLVQERLALGRPWLRMALILAAVSVFTVASAWLLQRYGRRTALR